jgi:tetratricopeptide (TPR) repeat protein
MKNALLILLFACTTLFVRSQSLPVSMQPKYDAAKSFTEKGQILSNYITSLKGTPPEQLKMLLPQLSYFTIKNDKAGIGYTQLYIGILFVKMGDMSESLKYGISALRIFEDVEDTFALLKTYTVIGNSYLNSQNFEESLSDYKKGLPASRNFDMHYYSIYLDGIASAYNAMHLPDSAMPYIQEALRIGYNRKDSMEISNCLAVMGDTYLAMGQNEIARSFLRQSISLIKKTDNFYSMYRASLASGLNEISRSFFNTLQYDSSLAYARQALIYD